MILGENGQDSGEKTLPDLGHDLFKYVMGKIYGQTTYIDWFDLPDEFIGAVGSVVALFLIAHPKVSCVNRNSYPSTLWRHSMCLFVFCSGC